MSFNIITEESNLTEMVDWFYNELNNACEKFIQEYADTHDLSFDCAYYFLKKFYDVSISVDIEDNHCCCVFTSKCKPIEEILSENIRNSDCEKELLNFGSLE